MEKINFKKRVVLTISFFVLVGLQTRAQKLNPDSVKSYLLEHFNGQVAIKRNTHFIFKENFGYKERFFGTLINDSTVFNIGQISQTMIYYFVQHLSSLSQLKPTDPVDKYIKNFPYPNIQIQHLLNHQSGLPNLYVKLYHREHYNDWNIKLEEREKRFDNEDILNILSKKKPQLVFTPGDSTSYSDINYLILCSLIEKITFTPFEDFVSRMFEHHHFIFKPICSSKKDTLLNKAFGYILLSDSTLHLNENLSTRGFPFDDGTYGNQHIYLSAQNLALWGQYLLENLDIDYLINNPEKEIMGGFKFDSNLNAVIKIGAFGGTYTRLIFIPSTEMIVVINSNVMNQKSSLNEFDELIKYLGRVN